MTLSIITATRNAAAHLQHCLTSVSAQTVPCEHIIIDGASTDGTVGVVEEYLKAGTGVWGLGTGNPNKSQISARQQAPSPQPPLAPIFISEPDHGLYDALNKGIGMAAGDIVGILHADDFYPSPDVLAKVAAVFDDPAVEACYGDLLYVKAGTGDWGLGTGQTSPATMVQLPATSNQQPATNEQPPAPSPQPPPFKIVRYWQAGPYAPEKFKWGWMPPHPTFFVRRSVYEKYGLFNLELGTAADYELMLRLLLKYRIRCAYLPEVLVCMRVGGASNRSIEARLKANRMDRRAWMVNGLRPYPWTIFFKPLRKIPQWWRRPG